MADLCTIMHESVVNLDIHDEQSIHRAVYLVCTRVWGINIREGLPNIRLRISGVVVQNKLAWVAKKLGKPNIHAMTPVWDDAPCTMQGLQVMLLPYH